MNDKAEWLSGVNHEILFWTRYLQTQGSEWPEDYLFRINPHAELQPYLADLLEGCVGKPKILDVGAGPMSCLGKCYQGSEIEIIATDALADHYDMLPFPDKLPILRTIRCDTELLSGNFCALFDIVHARNTLDHSYDPNVAILEMIKVCKKGGFIFTDHEANEAIKENWEGFHQWNFSVEHRDIIIANKRQSFSLLETIRGQAEIKEISQDGSDWVRCVIKKI